MISTSFGTRDTWRLPQARWIYPKSAGNSLRAFTACFIFEVQQVEHRDLAIGFQFACEHRRTDAPQPKPADHSQQSQPPPAGIEADRNYNHQAERGTKMFGPTKRNIQFIGKKIAQPCIES